MSPTRILLSFMSPFVPFFWISISNPLGGYLIIIFKSKFTPVCLEIDPYHQNDTRLMKLDCEFDGSVKKIRFKFHCEAPQI